MTTPVSPPKPDRPILAIAAILIAVFGLSVGDALIKGVSGDFGLWQIFVLRSLPVLGLLGLVAVLRMPHALKWPKAAHWVALRSAIMVVMWVSYYFALPHLQLAVAAAGYYSLPIFMTLFSALFLKDRIGLLGWVAVPVGILGVGLILRPSAGDFNLYAIFPLIAAILYALAMVLTRAKCRDVHPITMAAWLNIAFILTGLVASAALAGSTTAGFLTGPWIPMGSTEWVAIAVMAIAILCGSVGAATAYTNGPPAMLGTLASQLAVPSWPWSRRP